jgi:hypothetical protein
MLLLNKRSLWTSQSALATVNASGNLDRDNWAT